MKKLTINVLLFLLSITANAQITFVKHLTDSLASYFAVNTGIQTPDGNYAIGGYVANGSGGVDYYLMKIDSLGVTQWSRRLNKPGTDEQLVAMMWNGYDYVTVGNSLNAAAYMVTFFSNGSLYYAEEIEMGDSEHGDSFHSVEPIAGGGNVMTGRSDDTISHDAGMMILVQGSANWSKKVNGVGEGRTMKQTSDHGYIALAGGSLGDPATLLKMDSTGTISWAKSYDGIDLREWNSVYQTSDGGYLFGGTNYGDFCLVKTNSTGDTLWTKTYGGGFTENCYSIKPSHDGGYILAGQSSNWGNADYVVRTDSLGNVIWSKYYVSFSSGVNTAFQTQDGGFVLLDGVSRMIKTDSLGNAGCMGVNAATTSGHAYFTLSIPFFQEYDPGTIVNNISSPISSLGKFITICNNFSCSLTVSPPSVNCGAGVTLSASMSGTPVYTYSWTPTGSATASITVDPDSATVYSVVVTDGGGCSRTDSVLVNVSNPDSASISINACDSISINGQLFTASGNYTQSLVTSKGCDSTLTLNLTVNYLDVSTSTSGATITASTTGANYQWLDSTTAYAIIPGETNNSFTATQNGNYAVAINDNGCLDTSNCVYINLTGINGVKDTDFLIFSNPSYSQVTIHFKSIQNNTVVKISNAIGEVIKTVTVNNQELLIKREGMPPGIYFVQIISEARRIQLAKIILR